MKLSDLPAELFREVLYLLDPGSFYMCLQTAKLFEDHALTSTDLLVKQILQIPGFGTGENLRKMPANILLKTFRWKAAGHLKHGSWMTDISIADLRGSRTFKIRDKWLRKRPQAFVEVERATATIRIYYMTLSHFDTNNGRACPHLKHIITPDHLYKSDLHYYSDVVDGQPSPVEVLKVAMSLPTRTVVAHAAPRLAVLYRLRNSGFKEETTPMKLLLFQLDDEFGPIFMDDWDIDSSKKLHVLPLAAPDEDEWITKKVHILSMAVSDADEVVTLSQVGDLWDGSPYKVTLRKRELEGDDVKGRVEHSEEFFSRRSLNKVLIRGTTVHVCPSTVPLPQWSARYISRIEDIARRDTYLPGTVEAFHRPSFGRVLAHHHHCKIQDDNLNDGRITCLNTALTLAISRETHPTFINRLGAYLLKAVHHPGSCRKFLPDADHHSLSYVFVAELGTMFDMTNLSTLGLKLAVSPKSTRIAIASWKTVRVWALDADAFLDPHYSLGWGEGVPGDYAFLDGPGWQYYSCERTERECVVLEPIELPSAGVVYELEFQGENELWGWCEQGLVRWNFGPTATRKRGVSQLN